MFMLQERVLPYSNRRAAALRHVIRGGSPRTFDVVNRKWLVARDGSIYNYTYYDPRLHELNGLSIFEFSPKHDGRSEEHTSELQSLRHLVCRLLLEKKKPTKTQADTRPTVSA